MPIYALFQANYRLLSYQSGHIDKDVRPVSALHIGRIIYQLAVPSAYELK